MASSQIRHLSVIESGPRSLSPAEQQQALAFPALREVRTVFCMIATDEISFRRCLATQGTKECFGCASPSRVCENCHSATLAFPEVTMCSQCLMQARKEESRAAYDGNPNITVQCHLAGGSYISAKTCHKTQGDACGVCPAPTRYCKKCQQRQSYYAEYGLCLSCTTNTFGRQWLAREERADQIEQILEAGTAVPIEREIHLPEPESGSAKPLRIMRPQPIENPCTNCGAAPIFFVRLKLCVDCFTNRWTHRRRVRGQFFETTETRVAFLELLPRLINTLARGRWFSVARFARQLKVNQLEARALLEKLEEAGIVSASAGARRASLLRRAEEIAALLVQLPELEAVPRMKIGKLSVVNSNRVIIMEGEEYRNAKQWARIRKVSPDKLIRKLKLIGARALIGLSDRGYALVRHYSVTDATRAIWSDVVTHQQDGSLRVMPRGTYYMENTYWGYVGAWARYFGVFPARLKKALQGAPRVKFPVEKGGKFWFYEQKTAERAAMTLIRERNKRRAKQQPVPIVLEAPKKSDQGQPEKRVVALDTPQLVEQPLRPKTVPTVAVGERYEVPREVATVIESFPWKDQRERDIFVLYLGIGCEPMIQRQLAERFKVSDGRVWQIQAKVRQRMTKTPGWKYIEPYSAKAARRSGGKKKLAPQLQKSGPQETPDTVISANCSFIIKAVVDFYGISVEEVRYAERGRRSISHARQVAMYLVRKHEKLSYPRIAAIFGRDHTTVIHGCQLIQTACQRDAQLRTQIGKLESSLCASGLIK